MVIHILYFAWVRERIGSASERIEVPEGIGTVSGLLDHLSRKDERHAEAFRDRDRLRAALDQNFVPLSAPLGDARELAIFPPVTGG